MRLKHLLILCCCIGCSSAEPQQQQMFSDIPPTKYIVKPGDTLMSITRKFYGEDRHWRFLAEENKDLLPDPDTLKAGQLLRIPDLPQDETSEPASKEIDTNSETDDPTALGPQHVH